MAKVKLTIEDAQARLDGKFPDSGVKLVTFDGVDRPCEVEQPDVGRCGFTRFNSALAYKSTQDLLYAMKRKVVGAEKAAREEQAVHNEVLADRLVVERVRLGFSRQEVADKLGIEKKLLMTYETAEAAIPADLLEKLAGFGYGV